MVNTICSINHLLTWKCMQQSDHISQIAYKHTQDSILIISQEFLNESSNSNGSCQFSRRVKEGSATPVHSKVHSLDVSKHIYQYKSAPQMNGFWEICISKYNFITTSILGHIYNIYIFAQGTPSTYNEYDIHNNFTPTAPTWNRVMNAKTTDLGAVLHYPVHTKASPTARSLNQGVNVH